MQWFRTRPKLTAALAGVVGLLVVALLWVVVHPSRSPEPATLGPPSPSTSTPRPLPTLTPSPAASPGSVDKRLQDALSQFGKGSSAFSSSFNMPGLQGAGAYSHLPRHDLNLRVFAEVPIGTVGYIVPTSLRKSYGLAKNVGTSWSLDTHVYGDPDYAQVFVQAGARGYPITCVITVDGKVTERRSTEGPYGRIICQG